MPSSGGVYHLRRAAAERLVVAAMRKIGPLAAGALAVVEFVL